VNPFLEQIGQKLKTERKARHLNQTDAAERAGLSRREISEIENGSFRGSVLKVQAYAMSLGFSLNLEIKRRPTFSELPGVFDED
jgi:transcriptional regulator with XRE-family HTH domain